MRRQNMLTRNNKKIKAFLKKIKKWTFQRKIRCVNKLPAPQPIPLTHQECGAGLQDPEGCPASCLKDPKGPAGYLAQCLVARRIDGSPR